MYGEFIRGLMLHGIKSIISCFISLISSTSSCSQFLASMLRKVYSLFFSFLWKNVSDKTAPEPELALNPEPELKPDAKPELEPNRECELELDPEPDEEEVDPIAMLAALPNATSKKDRFNPRLSPIREVYIKNARDKNIYCFHMPSPIYHIDHKQLFQIMYEIDGLMRYKSKIDCT